MDPFLGMIAIFSNGITTASSGGNLPHENMPPYLVLNGCIAVQGAFPSRG